MLRRRDAPARRMGAGYLARDRPSRRAQERAPQGAKDGAHRLSSDERPSRAESRNRDRRHSYGGRPHIHIHMLKVVNGTGAGIMTKANNYSRAGSEQLREPSRELTNDELTHILGGGAYRADPYKAFKFQVRLS
jgi:hypothetical protein